MAGEATWSTPAETQLRDYIAHLHDHAPTLSAGAAAELRAAADLVARSPGMGRPARWNGLLEWSVRRWRKLLVMELVGGELRVLALYDQRQDLSTVDPFSE